ncbi:hypothetical protein [Streptococcus halotolerans]|nr:hypothetical protein [Streptococcus halotolerans]
MTRYLVMERLRRLQKISFTSSKRQKTPTISTSSGWGLFGP